MKRFAVLFGLIAISTAVVTTSSFAEAPSVRDLPELRLLYDDGGAVSGTLQEELMDAYDVFDFVKDFNDAPADLTVSIFVLPPSPPASTIEVTDGVVDVYTGLSTGWAQYTVKVDDASTAGKGVEDVYVWDNLDSAVAKFSTFSIGGPTITTGRMFTPVVDANTQLFTRVWVGDELNTPSIPRDPASQSVDWEIYVNSVTVNDASLNYDLNGNYMGKVTELISQAPQGDIINVGGFGWMIGGNGHIQISGAGSISPGPWLVGIMATDTVDPDNKDATRLMVAKGMLGVATAGNTPNHTAAETFESLPIVTIAAAHDYETNQALGNWRPKDGYIPTLGDLVNTIGTGSHWSYNIMSSNDSFVDSVPLQIVNLATESLAPDEVPGVAEGKCLKATMQGAAQEPALPGSGLPGADLRNEGFRLSSRLFPNIEYGKVYTFSMSIATSATDPDGLPNYQMFMTSGDSASTSGYENTSQDAAVEALGWTETPQTPLPLASQGWFTLSVNYTAPATKSVNDFNGDGNFDAADDLMRFNLDMKPKGATDPDPLKYAMAVIRFWARTGRPDVTIWIDNMRVYESVYELDLANGAEVLNDSYWDADMAVLAGLGLTEQPTGAFDGTIEAFEDNPAKDMHEDLLDIGISTLPWDASGRRLGGIYGGLLTKKKYWAYDTSYGVTSGAGIDHTRNADSDTALKIVLKGPTSELPLTEQQAYQASLTTADIAASGDGLYAFEAYLAAAGDGLPFNQTTSTRRHPEVRITLNEMLPDPFGNNAGTIFYFGGLPDVSGDAPFNWQRVVVTMFSPGCVSFHATIMMMDATGLVSTPTIDRRVQVSAFNVPIYIDDMKFYKVADNLDQFDAELFE